MELVTVQSPDGKGSFAAQFAAPQTTPAPGIVIVPHIGGIAPDMGEWAGHYAAKGYFAIVPDVFWRVQPGVNPPTDEGRKRNFERSTKVDVDDCVRDVQTAIDYLKARPGCNGRVGVIGFCFGGKYAYLATTRLGVTAAASFHGVGIGDYLAEADKVAGRLSLHFGDSDPIVPMDEVTAIQAALGTNPRVDIGVYAGAAHNFTRKGGPTYQVEAASQSESRSDEALATLF